MMRKLRNDSRSCARCTSLTSMRCLTGCWCLCLRGFCQPIRSITGRRAHGAEYS